LRYYVAYVRSRKAEAREVVGDLHVLGHQRTRDAEEADFFVVMPGRCLTGPDRIAAVACGRPQYYDLELMLREVA
jgi:UDP-N-acetylmuramoylalanine-D-glutamate ligase